MALNLQSITQIFTKQEPRFTVGGYAEYDGMVAQIEAIGISPYVCDNREMMYVIGYYDDGSLWSDYWPTGRVFRGVQ